MQPYYEDDLVTLYHGDCLELADAYDDVLVAVLTEEFDELMTGRDYYERRGVVQDLTEAGHPDAVSADFAADRADEAESLTRRGLAS